MAIVSPKFPSCLIIPSSKDSDSDRSNSPTSVTSYELMKPHRTINFSGPNMKTLILSQDLQESFCIGSSHGWLILLTSINTHARILLLNPFLSTKIQLPTLQSFPTVRSIQTIPYQDKTKFRVEYDFLASFYDQIQQFIPKIVLSADPALFCNSDFFAVCMYKTQSKYSLLLYSHGEGDNSWTCLEKECVEYYDLVCSGHKLYALSSGPSVSTWDLRNKKKMSIQFPKLDGSLRHGDEIVPRNLYFSQWYLASSSNGDDNLFLVVRFIGEFVRYDGELVTEADTLPDDDTHPLVCPYTTVWFRVYKLDLVWKRWIEVDCLEDCAVFLGGNQSVVVSIKDNPECRGNAIYFTDSCWDRMDEDYLYGGHDMGVFYLENGRIEPVFDRGIERIVPAPMWVLPH